ncbi:hypothetical protein SAMN05444320_103450 [Streptoalloteichus hindustanus]|uniref:Uncharacterized protein n=1 Tax=Streptoalloteichus hindustanus TaxID=2017 RepID=A0A1M5B8J6_STRHI|nr:hypothetical protein SAMN05444320_103450 [Streptoalloteichus hindustanus]
MARAGVRIHLIWFFCPLLSSPVDFLSVPAGTLEMGGSPLG